MVVGGGEEADRGRGCEYFQQVNLEWTFDFDPDTEPKDAAYGTLTVEVAKAQRLPPASEFEDTVDSQVQVTFAAHVQKTKVKRKSVNPFWNESYQFEVPLHLRPCVFKACVCGRWVRPLLSGWLIVYRGGGGWVRGQKQVCVPKIDLQVRASLINFIFFLRKNFLMWVGGWVSQNPRGPI